MSVLSGRTTVFTTALVARFSALISLACLPSLASAQSDQETLTLDRARQYMLELINRDRAAKHLAAVKLDLVATAAGQKHADEMAAQQYLAHWNLDGKLP